MLQYKNIQQGIRPVEANKNISSFRVAGFPVEILSVNRKRCRLRAVPNSISKLPLERNPIADTSLLAKVEPSSSVDTSQDVASNSSLSPSSLPLSSSSLETRSEKPDDPSRRVLLKGLLAASLIVPWMRGPYASIGGLGGDGEGGGNAPNPPPLPPLPWTRRIE
mmetsp:Transcript_3478/g.5903  ORF Transcript_3478/g.5903 Transcript_3478/m.5903 type:complete len:164 (+) Transcript_3478:137-628(+)